MKRIRVVEHEQEIIQCDWCGSEHPIAEMEPEEAGEWICQSCYERDLERYGPIGGKEE